MPRLFIRTNLIVWCQGRIQYVHRPAAIFLIILLYSKSREKYVCRLIELLFSQYELKCKIVNRIVSLMQHLGWKALSKIDGHIRQYTTLCFSQHCVVIVNSEKRNNQGNTTKDLPDGILTNVLVFNKLL